MIYEVYIEHFCEVRGRVVYCYSRYYDRLSEAKKLKDHLTEQGMPYTIKIFEIIPKRGNEVIE